ncbi:MAG: hypothetical protein ACJAUQ_002107, partial [Maribacter sp.]
FSGNGIAHIFSNIGDSRFVKKLYSVFEYGQSFGKCYDFRKGIAYKIGKAILLCVIHLVPYFQFSHALVKWAKIGASPTYKQEACAFVINKKAAAY